MKNFRLRWNRTNKCFTFPHSRHMFLKCAGVQIKSPRTNPKHNQTKTQTNTTKNQHNTKRNKTNTTETPHGSSPSHSRTKKLFLSCNTKWDAFTRLKRILKCLAHCLSFHLLLLKVATFRKICCNCYTNLLVARFFMICVTPKRCNMATLTR